MPGKIKVFWLVSLVLVVAATAATAVKLWPRVEVSDLYRTYADMPGIDATFLHDFPLNDTTFIDVTTLHALSDSAWNSLCEDFISPHYPSEMKEIVVHGNSVTYTLRSRKNPHIKPNPLTDKEIDYVVLCPKQTTICFYHIENINQINDIVSFNTTNQLKK